MHGLCISHRWIYCAHVSGPHPALFFNCPTSSMSLLIFGMCHQWMLNCPHMQVVASNYFLAVLHNPICTNHALLIELTPQPHPSTALPHPLLPSHTHLLLCHTHSSSPATPIYCSATSTPPPQLHCSLFKVLSEHHTIQGHRFPYSQFTRTVQWLFKKMRTKYH